MKKLNYIFLWIVIILIYSFSKYFVFPPNLQDKALLIKELNQRKDIVYSLCLSPEVLNGERYAIIGGGKLSMPEKFKHDSTNPEMIILHGTEIEPILKFINSKPFKNTENKTIVITALALKRCLIENNPLWETFFKNFKQSGNIHVKEGEMLPYLNQVEFQVKDNLKGILLSFPEGRYFSRVQNYGFAHLLESDFSLQGLENPIKFLEIIHFPKPDGFDGTFEELIQKAQKHYHKKFRNNILQMNTEEGLLIPREVLPFIEPKRKDKIIPLISAIKLSENIYFSGLIRATLE